MKRLFALLAAMLVLTVPVFATMEEAPADPVPEASAPADPVPEAPAPEAPADPPAVEVLPAPDLTDKVGDVVEKVDEVLGAVPSLGDVSPAPDTPGEVPSQVPSSGDTIFVVEQAPQPDPPQEVTDGAVSDIPLGAELTGISVYAVSPVKPGDTNGLKSVLLSLLGDYDPVVVEYAYNGGNGYTNYLRQVQPDYVWLCSAALFALVIYCIFRLGGALIRD